MPNNDKLQLPVSHKLKQDFKKKSESMGFSSINEALRVLVHNFTYNQNITLQLMNLGVKNVAPSVEYLDEETESRLDEAYKAIKKGETKAIDVTDKNWLQNMLKSDW